VPGARSRPEPQFFQDVHDHATVTQLVCRLLPPERA
jgi:hypothetical protein